MNIPNRKSTSKKNAVITIAIVIVLTLGASVAYLAIAKKWFFAPANQQKNNKSINYDPPTNEQKNAAGSSKNGSSESQGSDQSPAPTPPSTSGGKATVDMTITAANQTSGTLYIRTLIQTIRSTGTCTLSMTESSGKTYAATAGVQANPSTSTCQGFNVPVSALAPGDWHIVIDFEDSSIKAVASKDMTIQ